MKTALLILILLCPVRATAQNEPASKPNVEPGLQVVISSLQAGKAPSSDVVVLPNVWLYVPSGTSPTPFLPPGPFTAVWSGFLALDIRSEYTFQAELNGDLKLDINGVTVLQVSGGGGIVAPGKSVRLNKGANILSATFQSPTTGDASLRLHWIPKGALPAPLPLNALTHLVNSADLQKAATLRLGRELFAEHRCIKCHVGAAFESGMIELSMDAPSFEGIGSRRNFDWMARWILDPKSQRNAVHMPRIFHGLKAKEDADATAAYLASLKGESLASNDKIASDAEKEAGKRLFEILHCGACHNAPDGAQADPKRVSLKQVNQKFAPGTLSPFLTNPEAHYTWTRMPNFKLSDDETAQLAAFLQTHGDPPSASPASTDTALLDRGKRLIQTSGCLNCHSLKLENQFTTKPLSELPPAKWQQGCLALVHNESSAAPTFGFSSKDRDALQAFAATDRLSLSRHLPTDFAERQMRNLNCLECHGKFEGFPPLEILGGKLKPEWTKAFIAGEISYKPRPWIESRMPSFAKRADDLARGMSMLHGYAPQTTPEASIDSDRAQVGQKLVSADGGFACVACHSVGKIGATQVFESAGINLAYSGDRLVKKFFVRWLYNPLAVDPTTKMPVYFDELGRSPLADVYDGDGAKQIDALWQYIRLGDKMPPPPGTEAP